MINEYDAVQELIENEDKYLEDLAKVTTIAELMAMYGIKYHSTVIYAIDKGYITATQSGSIWLISLDSAIAYYGKPDLEKIA